MAEGRSLICARKAFRRSLRAGWHTGACGSRNEGCRCRRRRPARSRWTSCSRTNERTKTVKPWEEDAEGYRSSIMVRATHLANAAAVEFTLNEARKLYTDFGKPPPPVPANAGGLAPCSILVTERHKSGTGERIGRIQFLQPDG